MVCKSSFENMNCIRVIISGENQGRFYNDLIKQADSILDRHLALLKKAKP
jgi:hypothetical protein